MSTTTTTTTTALGGADAAAGLDRERTDLLDVLRQARFFLRHTARGLTDDQARQRTTASDLTIGGLVKHVAAMERSWIDFVLEGAEAMPPMDGQDEAAAREYEDQLRLLPGETLAGVLADYDEVARRTEEVVAALPSLDASRALPQAPWFEPGARWSARRVLLHLVAETAQHSGHADIVRESLDGAKSMG